MKALFVHDHIFRVTAQGNIYSSGSLPYKVFERYLAIFDHMKVIGRSKLIQDDSIDNYALAEGEAVDFVLTDPKYNMYNIVSNSEHINKMIENEICKVDFLIIRMPSILGVFAAKIARKINKPLVIEVVGHAKDSFWNHGSIFGKLIAPFLYFITKYYVARSKHVLYVTKDFLQKKYPNNNHTVNCSNVEITNIDIDVLNKRLAKKCLKNEKSVLNFGMIGSLNIKYKGHIVALKALALIKNEIPPFKLQLLGSGDKTSLITEIKKLNLESNIEFCGVLPPGEKVFKWLDEIDLFLMPSLTEGLPRAMIEAMSRGCPALGSDAGGIPELLHLNYIHKKGDFKMLSQQIKNIINEKKLEEMSVENFDMSKKYTKNILDKRRIKFYKDSLNESIYGEKYN